MSCPCRTSNLVPCSTALISDGTLLIPENSQEYAISSNGRAASDTPEPSLGNRDGGRSVGVGGVGDGYWDVMVCVLCVWGEWLVGGKDGRDGRVVESEESVEERVEGGRRDEGDGMGALSEVSLILCSARWFTVLSSKLTPE